jgi:hypothetical protein
MQAAIRSQEYEAKRADASRLKRAQVGLAPAMVSPPSRCPPAVAGVRPEQPAGGEAYG